PDRDVQEEEHAERRAGGGRRRAPAVLSCIGERGPHPRGEPQRVEEIQAGEESGDQDARAAIAVERRELLGRCSYAGLVAVDDITDDEKASELQAARAPQPFPERTSGVRAARRTRGGGCAHRCPQRFWYGWKT